MTSPLDVITVCPSCHYGFVDPGGPGHEFCCPRGVCGHRWEAVGQTLRAIQGTDRRMAVTEIAVTAGGAPRRIVLAHGDCIIGRDETCNLILDNRTVSRRHAAIHVSVSDVIIQDLQSACGTMVNGEFINQPTKLRPGDQLVLGGTTLLYETRYVAIAATKSDARVDNTPAAKGAADVLHGGQPVSEIALAANRITFGRSTDRDVVLSGPMISSKHAVLERDAQGAWLSDVQSVSGTYINGKPIIRAQLVIGDRIQIGRHLFRFEGDRLIRTEQPTAIAVEAANLSKQIGDALLLDQLTFSLKPGEFVGLIGPSGAGKTTLLDALNGMRPATSGEVYLNNDPLYQEYARLRHHIGYVPQEDIIHRDLTVEQAMLYAARLRLPDDSSEEECMRSVNDTLESLELSHRRNVLISHLSGGQRKRVSVGVELLSRPGVLYLDEPTSGLDPGTESRLMELFRRLADQGRTVVCTTHVMENIDLFHKIVILAPGGKLAYFGPPQSAKAYFGIDKFCDLYGRIEAVDATEWQRRYRESSFYQELVDPVVRQRKSPQGKTPTQLAKTKSVSPVQQCVTLASRFVRLLWNDRSTLLVTLAQPLVITALICAVCRDINVINFLLVISAIWFGCSGSAQQIVKERAVYRRERMVNLRLDAYLLSKLLPLMAIATVQVFAMLLVTAVMEEMQGSWFWHFMIMVVAAWNGVGIGLLISALASNGDKAMSIVPLSLIPQIILAGVLVPLPEMNGATQAAAMLTPARWANHACESIVFDGRPINAELLSEDNLRPLWNIYPDEKLKEPQGRVDFLTSREGESVDSKSTAWWCLMVLLMFQGGLVIATCGVLKQGDTL